MKDNISHIHNCYGCGVCAASCPKNVIEIILNGDGFYEACVVDADRCIHCGICMDVCAFNHSELSLSDVCPLRSWSAWSNDKDVRKKCSSGGIGFEIGKQLIEHEYKAVGCRYDAEKQRAEHFIATTVDEFVQSIGSKYIQSYTEEAFRQIDRKQKYLVSGTPCQIDSFRRMIQKFHCEENFILMDFFCHCVPSMHAWKAYIKMLEPIIGKVVYASWRNKFEYGWHDNWLMGIDGTKTSKTVDWTDDYNELIKERITTIQSRKSQGDLFYKLFLGDLCMGPQCERDCKYKYNQSAADIRIGDLWGKTYKDNEDGVSALVAYTEKGVTVIEHLKNVTLVEHPFNIVAEGQMQRNAMAKELHPLVMYMLKKNVPLQGVAFKLVFVVQRFITKIKTLL